MMRQFLPHFRAEKGVIADDETMASSCRQEKNECFTLENKIWILKNMQAKFKINACSGTKQIIIKLKSEITEIKN